MAIAMCPESRLSYLVSTDDCFAKPELFSDKYGKLADTELGNFATIHERCVRALNIPTVLGLSQESLDMMSASLYYMGTQIETHLPNFYFSFDQDACVHFGYQELTFWQKYARFRGTTDVADAIKVASLFQKQAELVATFYPQKAKSLQELRDYAMRVKTIQVEQLNVRFALDWNRTTFFKSISSFERMVFSVISYFHSFIACVPNIPELMHLPKLFRDFVRKPHITFAQMQFTHNQTQKTVKIAGVLGSYDNRDFSGKIHFTLIDTKTDENYGTLTLQRQWEDYCRGEWYEDRISSPSATLNNRHLYVIDMIDGLGSDKQTQDRPVMRILTQIAVELFRRETEKELRVQPSYCDADVYVAAGFYTETMSKIQADLKAARMANTVFPKYRNLYSSKVYLFKENGKLSNKTGQEPLVDFDLHAKPITWDEQIAKNPLLGPGSGPVLPKFLKRNLFQYEKERNKK